MVGAGRKNDRNKFEGVLMGDVGTKSEDNAISEVGLYGFHDGAQSFGFKVDGTAVLGKPGRGRIYINGTDSTIESASYGAGGGGMKIDLDDGWLSIESNEAEEVIRIDGDIDDATDTPYLKLGTDNSGCLTYTKDNKFDIKYNSRPLLHIANDGYYL
jgi:hypothetical protein